MASQLGPFTQKEISDLPNDVLLIILKFCSATDIIGFSEAYPTERIEIVAGDKSLWKNVTIGPKNIRKYLKFLGQYTTKITLLGSHTKVLTKLIQVHKMKTTTTIQKTDLLPQSVIESIRLRCGSLKDLTLQNVALDSQEVKFSLFPKTLESLSLNNVYHTNLPQVIVSKAASPFCNLCKYLPKLKLVHVQNPWYYNQMDVEAIMDSSERITVIDRKPDHSMAGTFNFHEGELTKERGQRRIAQRLAIYAWNKLTHDALNTLNKKS